MSLYAFDERFYADLAARRSSFQMRWEHVVPAKSGYGWRVSAGQAFRITMVAGAQVVDLCISAAEDPHEHYAAGAQFYIEGARVTRNTRIWGTPPRSRPLATITADKVEVFNVYFDSLALVAIFIFIAALVKTSTDKKW